VENPISQVIPAPSFREAMIFPDDENGDVLRRMAAGGDDLTQPRAVDFTVVFPSEDAANQFAEEFRGKGYKTCVRFAEVEEDCPWDVIVVKNMVPTHEGITEFENELQDAADAVGGRNDGLTNNTSPPIAREERQNRSSLDCCE
jgi:Regulator of ribonuclease activity B